MSVPQASMGQTLVETALGWIGLAWSLQGLSRLQLPGRDAQGSAAQLRRRCGHNASPATPPAFIADLGARLVGYAAGDRVDFSDVPVDLSLADAFQTAIYAAARKLAYGETTTYGALAAEAGYPGLARETGQALGQNPVAIIVPCHRIVAAGGKPGGFSAPGGVASKMRLLAMEGARLAPSPSSQTAFAF